MRPTGRTAGRAGRERGQKTGPGGRMERKSREAVGEPLPPGFFENGVIERSALRTGPPAEPGRGVPRLHRPAWPWRTVCLASIICRITGSVEFIPSVHSLPMLRMVCPAF